jgi:hypothetical protein
MKGGNREGLTLLAREEQEEELVARDALGCMNDETMKDG